MAVFEFTGDAIEVAEVRKFTVTGTDAGGAGWAAADTIAITVGGRTITVTLGATEGTNTLVVGALVAAWNGDTMPGTSSVSPSGGGATFQEFEEVTATDDDPIVTLTMDTAGQVFASTVAVTAAGDGGITSNKAVIVTAGSGPNVWCGDNFRNLADNTKGTLPGADQADSLFIRDSSVNLLWNLGMLKSDDVAVASAVELHVDMSYTGLLGLPALNQSASTTYDEYRTRFATNAFAPLVGGAGVTVGEGSGTGSGRIQLDCGASTEDVVIENTGSAENQNQHAVAVTNLAAGAEILVKGGSLDVDRLAGQTSGVTTATLANGAVYRSGTGTTYATSLIARNTSSADLSSAVPALTTRDSASVLFKVGAITTLQIYGGLVEVELVVLATIGQLNIGPGGTARFARGSAVPTITNTRIEAGCTIDDPGGVVDWTNAIVQGSCGLEDWTPIFGRGRTIHPEG